MLPVSLWGLFIGTFLAATVLPFSSDALYMAVLAASGDPLGCLVVGTLGNWLGSIVTYFMGRLAKWEWIEKLFRVSRSKLEGQKAFIDRWGVWSALLCWVPFVGDVIAIALGFYRCRAVPCIALMLVGKAARFYLWNLILGAFM